MIKQFLASLSLAGMVLASNMLPVSASATWRNLPVKLYNNNTTSKSIVVTTNNTPKKNFAIRVSAWDADVANEGQLRVNQKLVNYNLFSGAAQKSNDKTSKTFLLVVPGSYMKQGQNVFNFRRTNTLGFEIRSVQAAFNTSNPVGITLEGSGGTPTPTPTPTPAPTPAAAGQITWREAVDQYSKPHDLTPIPAIPSSYCGSHYGSPTNNSVVRKPGQPKCDRKFLDDASELSGFTEFNIWNHIARRYDGKYANPNGQTVTTGNAHLAVLTKKGKWITREFKANCSGRLYAPVANGIDRGKNGGNPFLQPCSNKAVAGYGVGNWNAPGERNFQVHGWTGQRLNVAGEDIRAVAGYFPAWLSGKNLNDNGQYLLNVGMDKKGGKAADKTDKFTGAFSSRYIYLEKGGKETAVFGSTLSGAEWKKLCQAGNLPKGFPFQKGCNVPSK